MFFKNPKCPICGEDIKDLILDFESGQVICVKCKSALDPNLVINNSTVNFLANLIPPDIRDRFLFNLGFERKPIARTPKLALWSLIVMMILGSVAGLLINFPNFLMMVGVAFLWGLFIWKILRYYKEEEIPKWRKKKAT